MILEGFDAGWRRQREWGWLLAIWLFLSNVSGALFLYYQLLDLPVLFALLSLCLMLAGGVVLLLEQGSPSRAWRAILRIRTSWLSRGVVFVTCFIVASILFLAPHYIAGWPWSAAGVAGRALAWIAAISAFMILLYPAFFLANNVSIPFWNTYLLPVVLLSYAAVSGMAVLFLSSPAMVFRLPQPSTVAIILVTANIALQAIYLSVMHRSGGAARESVRLLVVDSQLRWSYWLAVIGVGSLLPLLMVVIQPTALLLPIAGLCLLIGSFTFRYCLLKAGVYLPASLAQDDVALGRLGRTSAELRREYECAGGA